MATLIDKKRQSLIEKMAGFAKKELAGKPGLLHMDGFPLESWKRMGKEHLLGVNITEEFGGLGGGYLEMAVAGEALTAEGHSLGMALSWVIHHAVAGFLISGFGNEAQKKTYLPGMAKGSLTGSFAVSEPETGAHPKHLKTDAKRKGDVFVLNGEKSYLSNGPIADVVVVIAQTSFFEGKKGFTAFLVPMETPGLTLTKAMHLDILKPSPHCGLRLQDCVIPASTVLGEMDRAYPDMAKPFREKENTLVMGPLVGAMTVQLKALAAKVRKDAVSLSPAWMEELGKCYSRVQALRILACEAAAMLDSQMKHDAFLSIVLAFRSIALAVLSDLEPIIQGLGMEQEEPFGQGGRDLQGLLGLAKNVNRLQHRKLGQKLLDQHESCLQG